MPVKHHYAQGPFDRGRRRRDNVTMKKLSALRKARGLTQQQLAEMAGTDQATVSKIESASGYNYTHDMITRIAEALKVEPAELFGLTELQERVIQAFRSIEDPEKQQAAIVVLESMAKSKAD